MAETPHAIGSEPPPQEEPLAYLTAQLALALAGFQAGKTLLAGDWRIGRNAVTQLARALGAKHAMSSTTNHAKAEQAKVLGFNEIIDAFFEKLGDGVRRITGGYGADIVIDGIGSEVFTEALATLAPGGSLTTLGYSPLGSLEMCALIAGICLLMQWEIVAIQLAYAFFFSILLFSILLRHCQSNHLSRDGCMGRSP